MSDKDGAVPAVPQEKAVTLASALQPSQPDGSVEGYNARNTLPVGVELARQLARRRTLLTLGFLAILPGLLLLAFEIGRDGRPGGSRNLVDIATSSGLNFAVFTVFASTSFLLVVVVALFFGDTIASESSWSSLRYLLAAPIPRGRLLRKKAAVSAILSFAGLVLLAVIAVVAGVIWYGTGEMLTPTGEAMSFPGGLLRLVGAVVYLALHLTWIAGLALLLSVSTDAPLGAVGGAVLVSILSQILDEITALGDLRVYLPTHFSLAWRDLLTSEIDWTSMANGVFSALTYATVFWLLARRRFSRKDITS